MTMNAIIREYYQDEAVLECLYYDIEPALEAENIGGDVTAKTTSESVMNNIRQRITKIINELIGIITRAFGALDNAMTKVIQTDHGFSDQCRKAMKSTKPLQAVKLIAYDYQDPFLDQQLNKWDTVVQKTLTSLKTDLRSEQLSGRPDVLDLSSSDMVKAILKMVGAPSNITDMNLYFLYLRREYRKGKVERLFKRSEIRQYYNMTQNCKNLKNMVSAKQIFMKENVTRVKSALQQISENRRVGEGIRKRVLRQSTNASHLFNMYVSFLKAYTQLKTEEILSYRAVLKKILRF